MRGAGGLQTQQREPHLTTHGRPTVTYYAGSSSNPKKARGTPNSARHALMNSGNAQAYQSCGPPHSAGEQPYP
jgi:hypothetical protein